MSLTLKRKRLLSSGVLLYFLLGWDSFATESKRNLEWSLGSFASFDFLTPEFSGTPGGQQFAFFYPNAPFPFPLGTNPRVGYFITPQLQITASLGFSKFSDGEPSLFLQTLGGIHYSLELDIDDSFFLGMQVGNVWIQNTLFNKITYLGVVSLGKRFTFFFKPIFWNPEMNLKIRGPLSTEGRVVLGYSFVPLQFSFIFR